MVVEKLEFFVNMDRGYAICRPHEATHIIRTTPNTYSVYLKEDGRRQVPEKAARKVMARVVYYMWAGS
jgi:hypothetical protein